MFDSRCGLRKCRPVKVGAVEHSCLPATTFLNAFLTLMAVPPLERSYSTSYRFGISSDIAAPSGNRGSYYLGFSGTIVARTARQADMPSPAPVRVKCAQPLQDPAGIWICWVLGGARAGSRIDRVFNSCAFLTVQSWQIASVRIGRFDMHVETNVPLMGGQTFKLVCEQCGSLTVALPIEAQPDPYSILKCGRCGSPRGTLQSLRDTSIQAGIRHPV